MSNAIAVVLIYIGLANAFLAVSVGTCTQGQASQLGGIALSLFLYFLAGGNLVRFGARMWTFYALVPAALLIVYQAGFALRLSFGFVLFGTSACETLSGMEFEMDGNEALYSFLWLVATIGLSAFLVWQYFRTRKHLKVQYGGRPDADYCE